MREIREATKALNPIKTKLRAFEGMKVSVPGGRVAIGVSKEAVYGYAIFAAYTAAELMANQGAAVVRAFDNASFIAPWAFLDSMEYASVASGFGDAAMTIFRASEI